jgi:hypothetical protein
VIISGHLPPKIRTEGNFPARLSRRKSIGFSNSDPAARGTVFSYRTKQCRLGCFNFRHQSATIRQRRSRQCDLACRTSLGTFWGLIYRKWKVDHLGIAARPLKLLQGVRPTTQRGHASAVPVAKPDHDMHGGPAGCVHISTTPKQNWTLTHKNMDGKLEGLDLS